MTKSRRSKMLEGGRIRVLVVDDSIVVRGLIAQALSGDPQIDVVGFAQNGEVALRNFAELQPDVITLDLEMPVMDGLETLRRLKTFSEKPVVIMISTRTERGATATIDALSLGADDYVTKPSSVGDLPASLNRLRADVTPRIKQFFAFPGETPIAPGALPNSQPATRPTLTEPLPSGYRLPAPPRKVLAIGVSTGGPNALATILPAFPADFPLPILIVQHMPATFTKLLAERLNTMTPLRVAEAIEGAAIEAGCVWIAPGGYHMNICKPSQGAPIIKLTQDAPEHSCRPSVDVLFRSVAEHYGGSTIAAVLTGMGHDGTSGAQALHAKGAYVIAQDAASSVVWGMPAGVVNAGAADAVVDLNRVVPEIMRNL